MHALRETIRLELGQVEIEDGWRGIGKLADGIDDVSHEDGAATLILILHGSHQMNHLTVLKGFPNGESCATGWLALAPAHVSWHGQRLT